MIMKEHFQLFGMTTVCGIIYSVIEKIYLKVMVNVVNEWTQKLNNITLVINSVISMILIIIVWFALIRKMKKSNIFKSGLIIFVYSIAVLIIEQIAQKFGIYNVMLTWLFMPIEIFNFITYWLMKIEGFPIYLALLVSYISPLVYVIFGKQNNVEAEG